MLSDLAWTDVDKLIQAECSPPVGGCRRSIPPLAFKSIANLAFDQAGAFADGKKVMRGGRPDCG
jgi:hypothetical protein